jgi:choline dehydrogenase
LDTSILKKLGIATKVALPGVGENMQDHNVAGMSYAPKSPISGHLPYSALPSAQDVFGNETASFAASTLAKSSNWARTASALSDRAISASTIEKRLRIQHNSIFTKNVTIAQLYLSNLASGLFSQFWPFLLGSVHLALTDKINDHVITLNLLSRDFDIIMLAAVGRLSRKAYSAPPLSDLIVANTSLGYSTLPPDVSDEQWAA